MKREIKKYLISENCNLKEAIRLLEKTLDKCLIVIDSKEKLKGTITDGDIRRLFITNKEINKIILDDINYNFYFETNLNKFLSEVNKKFNIIPIIINDKIVYNVAQ